MRNHERRAGDSKVELEVRGVLAKMGEPEPLTNPLGALQQTAGEARQWKQAIRVELDKLQSLTFHDNFGAEQLRAVVRAYQDAIDRCARIEADMVRLGLDQRVIALQEAQVNVMHTIVEAVLVRFVPADQHADARALLAAKVREVAA